MAQPEVEEFVVHLEKSTDLGTMEHGFKLVGAALSHRTLNEWGVRNILRSAWKEMGEIEVKRFRDTTFIITAQDRTAVKILEQVPWAVMKQSFSVKRRPPELALEEIQMELVPFWAQIRGVPLYMSTDTNVKEVGEFVGQEETSKARGFVRVTVTVNIQNHLQK